ANCDGPFFKNKVVAVVGGGNSALDAAEVLSKIAKQVYLIHRHDSFKGFESLQEEIKERENIEIMMESEVKLINGGDKVESALIFNKKENSEREIKLDGIFIEVGRIASTDLVAEFVERNEKNQIIIDNQGATKTPGLFAAGDVTSYETKQITVATGQATIAALSVYKYLQNKTGKKFIDRKY
ncbi:MAG: FAD-dependent oxidoreductase, partial [Candidatus Paceibacterota bacterium]